MKPRFQDPRMLWKDLKKSSRVQDNKALQNYFSAKSFENVTFIRKQITAEDCVEVKKSVV
jgi:hypothetical protein